jgi:hypothetical protein
LRHKPRLPLCLHDIVNRAGSRLLMLRAMGNHFLCNITGRLFVMSGVRIICIGRHGAGKCVI